MKTTFCLLALVAVATALALPSQQDNAMSCLMCEVGVRAAENPADREAHTVEDVSSQTVRLVIIVNMILEI